jgi:hypothetical protein
MEIAKREEDMDALFKQFDEDQDGELSAKEFDKLLKHLGLNNKHSKVQRERVVRYITKQPKELCCWRGGGGIIIVCTTRAISLTHEHERSRGKGPEAAPS